LSFPANVIPVFGSQRPYVDLNFALGSFGVNGGSVSSLALLSGFTFTRASLAMGYDATGKLTYGPNNLCLQSQALGTSPWGSQSAGAGSAPIVTNNYAVAPDGTMTATRVQVSLGGGTVSGDQSYPVQGCTCPTARGSFYVKTNDGSTKTIYVRGQNAATKVVTGTWTRIDFEAGTLSGTQFGIGLRGGQSPACSDSADLLVWGAQLEAVTYQTTPSTYYPTTSAAYYGPRLVYDPVTLASLGILVEEARTNLLLYSQDFATTWVPTAATVTANATTSPDGTSNADTLKEDSATTGHYVEQSIVKAASAITYTTSVYVKRGSGTRNMQLRVDALSGANAVLVDFDLGAVTATFNSQAGTFTYSTGTATITSVGSGWYRCSYTLTTGTELFVRARCSMLSGSTVTYTGDNTSSLFLFQAQLEAGTGASSPIPTTTAAVTRAADVPNLTGLTLPAAYTLVAEGICPTLVSGNFPAMLGFTGSVGISVAGSNGAPGANMGGATYNTSFGALRTAGQSVNAAFRAETNNANGAGNGTLGAVDTSFTPTTGAITNFYFGLSSSAANPWNSTISRIRIFNRALADAQLQSLTA
jgi:hypothetical protein